MSRSRVPLQSKIVGKSLRRSESHYRTVAEATTDAIITINAESTILLVNPAAETIFGYTTKEMIGRQLTMLMPQYHRHLHREGMARYLETGHRHLEWGAVKLPGLHKSGAEIELEISFLEFNKEGQRFFTGIVRKVTSRSVVDSAAQVDHGLFAAIVNQATVGISVMDAKGQFTFVNDKLCQMLGRAREELLQGNITDSTHVDDRKTLRGILKQLHSGANGVEVERRCERSDGSLITVRDCLSVLHQNDQQQSVLALTLLLASL